MWQWCTMHMHCAVCTMQYDSYCGACVLFTDDPNLSPSEEKSWRGKNTIHTYALIILSLNSLLLCGCGHAWQIKLLQPEQVRKKWWRNESRTTQYIAANGECKQFKGEIEIDIPFYAILRTGFGFTLPWVRFGATNANAVWTFDATANEHTNTTPHLTSLPMHGWGMYGWNNSICALLKSHKTVWPTIHKHFKSKDEMWEMGKATELLIFRWIGQRERLCKMRNRVVYTHVCVCECVFENSIEI